MPGKKYPMVLTIHGGPAGMYGFDWFHEFQVYAAHGWAVFFTNPRGSTGYGEKFERGIQHRVGRQGVHRHHERRRRRRSPQVPVDRHEIASA